MRGMYCKAHVFLASTQIARLSVRATTRVSGTVSMQGTPSFLAMYKPTIDATRTQNQTQRTTIVDIFPVVNKYACVATKATNDMSNIELATITLI